MPLEKRTSEPVAIVDSKEPSIIINLADGNTIVGRLVVTAVRRHIDEQGQPVNNPDGSPSYNVASNVLFSAMEK